MTATFQVIIEPEDGIFVTYVPALDFASTFGPTREVALNRTREMLAGFLDSARNESLVIDIPLADQRLELVDLVVSA